MRDQDVELDIRRYGDQQLQEARNRMARREQTGPAPQTQEQFNQQYCGGGVAGKLSDGFGQPVRVPDPMIGIGGAPTRNTTLPHDAAGRKEFPMATGLLDYFPDALAAVSNLSKRGNDQHNPGQPLHWARGKSGDEADTLIRHMSQRGTFDIDGVRHSTKVAWRALAMLQKEIEEGSQAVQQARVVEEKCRVAAEYEQKRALETEHALAMREAFLNTDPDILNRIIREAKAALDARGMLCGTAVGDRRDANKLHQQEAAAEVDTIPAHFRGGEGCGVSSGARDIGRADYTAMEVNRAERGY